MLNASKLASLVSIVLCGSLFSACQSRSSSPAPAVTLAVETTDWMPRHQFQKYLDQKERADDTGKNFWAKGHSVETIQSRWENGYQQYRITIMANPKGKAFWWMWYFEMSKADFQKKLSSLGGEGYQLVSYSSNLTPAGEEVFAAVWHRTK